jgi:FAD dependent oxidoreductase
MNTFTTKKICSLLSISLLSIFCLVSLQAQAEEQTLTADVVVYGATPGGVIAAVAAKRSKHSVILIEPTNHIGGIMTSGLGMSDICKFTTIGATSQEFFRRVGKYYGKDLRWNFEPHIAEQVFNDFVKETKLELILNETLEDVKKEKKKITQIKTRSGKIFKAKIFIDGTYEGDLLAKAGVSYTFGRESRSTYGESLAGVRPFSNARQFNHPTSAYDKNGKLLPGINYTTLAPEGTGDKKIMAYNFRLCLTKNQENVVPITKPTGYDPKNYELLANYLRARKNSRVRDVLMFHMVTENKACINRDGPFSTNFIGENYDWPEGDPEKRAEIYNRHKDYTLGLLYFLWNDPRVPNNLRQSFAPWGFCKDEFVENNFFPYQIYVREARRMIGEYVMTEKDLLKDLTKPDSIAVASCPIEVHEVQRIVTEEGLAKNEGFTFVKVKPYALPYRSLIPKKSEVENLIVPVAVSASHIAYSSLRMEPVFMALGHTAGVAASEAIKSKKAVQDINIEKLKTLLKEHTQVM